MTFRVGDEVLHKQHPGIRGVIRVILGESARTAWTTSAGYNYEVVESMNNYNPLIVTYKYDPAQAGDLEDDI